MDNKILTNSQPIYKFSPLSRREIARTIGGQRKTLIVLGPASTQPTCRLQPTEERSFVVNGDIRTLEV